MAIHVALALSLLGSLALAGVLLSWADRVPGARMLVLFLVGVAVWIVGNELPSWSGPDAQRPALILLATAALTSAVFVHFTLTFCRVSHSRILLAAIYGTGLAATLTAFILPAGRFEPHFGIRFIAVPNATGWVISAVWAALAGFGQLVLLRTLIGERGLIRRQVAAVAASSAWGLACMSGYAFPALGLPIYPWPLLGLPLYPVILVYGILRYRVLVANAWARRALAWTLLVACAGLVAGGAAALGPLLRVGGAAWLSGVAGAAAVLLLAGPIRRLAERIVYPGRTVSAGDLRQWRTALARCDTPKALCSTASTLLENHLAMPVEVTIGAAPSLGADLPAIHCRKQEDGWSVALTGWSAAPPGPRRLAGLFGDVLAEQVARVEGLEAMRERERERQHQARLAELGALAATVAHDVRNPLNVISMAAALAPPDVRTEIADGVARIARLADDLLDFAKPWSVKLESVDLRQAAQAWQRRYPHLALGAGLQAGLLVQVDLRRLHQAVTNLLDNIEPAAPAEIDAERSGGIVRIHVCDDGPGIPDDIRSHLFQPFVSRRAGGTGLGLAIVAKIMEAHGGGVALTERPGWTTCFTLTLFAAP